jgi:hypothetical protein
VYKILLPILLLPLLPLLLLPPQWTDSTATTAAAACSYDVLKEGVQARLYIVVVYYSYQGICIVDLRGETGVE